MDGCMLVKKKWLILPGVILAVIVIPLGLLQFFFYGHMYPQDALHTESNLAIKGVIASIEENKVSQGMTPNSYHIYRYYLSVNITEITWADKFISETYGFSYENKTLNSFSGNMTYIGFDGFEAPNFTVGQEIECKGYYVPVTDSPYSFKLSIAPSITGSYLKIL
jgi:hypothetical protein